MVLQIIDYLAQNGLFDQVYESLQQDDHSKVVLAALDVLMKTRQMPYLEKVTKCANRSTMFRKQGNEEYQRRNYREALMWYNNAIAFAPENSTEFILGYSNRSAILFKIKAYQACLNDIDTCSNIGCTDQPLADKLKQRKRECQQCLSKDNRRFIMEKGTFGWSFFNFNVKRNPQIPCTSLDVDIVKKTDKLKAVAVRNIEVGTVVALETAYACDLQDAYKYLACSYCHKFDLNLIPCDKCCDVMFCSETCKVRCNNEYHDIECQIMHCITFTQKDTSGKLTIKAAIKMRKMCSSWAEFTEASKNIGAERMKESSVNEIYDEKKRFSMLCFDRDLHFLHGQLLNAGVLTAVVICYLLEVPSFFPERQKERNEAIQALARVMINLRVFYRTIAILNHTVDPDTMIMGNAAPNRGWFSFTGKLKHCCDANLQVLGLNNKVALIAIKSIKKGDELTISYRYVRIKIKQLMYNPLDVYII